MCAVDFKQDKMTDQRKMIKEYFFSLKSKQRPRIHEKKSKKDQDTEFHINNSNQTNRENSCY